MEGNITQQKSKNEKQAQYVQEAQQTEHKADQKISGHSGMND